MDDDARVSVKPAWLAPFLILGVIVVIVAIGRKKEEAVENPIVDGAIITVIVFAFAALYRKVFSVMDAPGAVAFFGGPVQAHPEHPTHVDTEESYA